MNTIFIDMPWTDYPANGILVTSDQIKEVFNIIVKAFLCKYNYEKQREQGNILEVQKYDLNNEKVFNGFINLIIDNVLDPVARDYALATVRNIRNNNLEKRQVKQSYETIYTMLEPNSKNLENLRTILADTKKMVDFYYLFDKCNTTALTEKSSEIREIITTRNIISKMSDFEIKGFID